MIREQTGGAFGGYLRDRRRDIGMTLEHVAIALGVSPQFVHRVESGITPFPAEHLRALAHVLDCDPDELVVEYTVPLLSRIYKRAGLPEPTWRLVPAAYVSELVAASEAP